MSGESLRVGMEIKLEAVCILASLARGSRQNVASLVAAGVVNCFIRGTDGIISEFCVSKISLMVLVCPSVCLSVSRLTRTGSNRFG